MPYEVGGPLSSRQGACMRARTYSHKVGHGEDGHGKGRARPRRLQRRLAPRPALQPRGLVHGRHAMLSMRQQQAAHNRQEPP